MNILKFIENMLYNKNKNKMPDEIYAGFVIKIYQAELDELKKNNDNTEENLLNRKRLEISIEALTNYFERLTDWNEQVGEMLIGWADNDWMDEFSIYFDDARDVSQNMLFNGTCNCNVDSCCAPVQPLQLKYRYSNSNKIRKKKHYKNTK